MRSYIVVEGNAVDIEINMEGGVLRDDYKVSVRCFYKREKYTVQTSIGKEYLASSDEDTILRLTLDQAIKRLERDMNNKYELERKRVENDIDTDLFGSVLNGDF